MIYLAYYGFWENVWLLYVCISAMLFNAWLMYKILLLVGMSKDE